VFKRTPSCAGFSACGNGVDVTYPNGVAAIQIDARRTVRKGDCDAHRLPSAGRRLKEVFSSGVVLLRQENRSKIDNYNCPRQVPHL
jgi:hypothetical protein